MRKEEMLNEAFKKVDRLAHWLHDNYEAISIEKGWNTQENCKAEFKDLPVKNKNVMYALAGKLINEYIPESNKELLSKIEDLKLTIEALEDHVRDKTIERDKAQKMNERLLEALQNYDGVFNSPISRRKIDSDMANECRKFGRETLALLQSTTQEKGECIRCGGNSFKSICQGTNECRKCGAIKNF